MNSDIQQFGIEKVKTLNPVVGKKHVKFKYSDGVERGGKWDKR